jgi:hypothetical protein
VISVAATISRFRADILSAIFVRRTGSGARAAQTRASWVRVQGSGDRSVSVPRVLY